MDRCDEVYCDDTGRHPVGSGRLSRVWESNLILFDWKTGDSSPGDMVCVPLKEGQEERAAHCILHGLERCTCVWGDGLHEISLQMEGLLQSRIVSLRVIVRHPGHDGHQSLPPLHILLQPPSMCLLCPHKSP